MSSEVVSSPRIRRMTVDDLDAVMRIERAAHQRPWSEDLVRRELDHDWSTTLLLLIGESDGSEQIAGYIIFWMVHDEIHILNVATDPARRRLGFGRALMMAAEETGLERDATISTLEVRRSNEPALQLYRSLGYRQVGLRPRYYADNNEDAIVMVKELPRRQTPVQD
jgi:ribosomal-protein-alanine N-acetyltransferase